MSVLAEGSKAFVVKLVNTYPIRNHLDPQELTQVMNKALQHKNFNKSKLKFIITLNAIKLILDDKSEPILEAPLANIVTCTRDVAHPDAKLVSITVMNNVGAPFVAWVLKSSGASSQELHTAITAAFQKAFSRIQQNREQSQEMESGA